MWAWCAREAVVPPDEGERSINDEVKSAYDAAVIEISRENSWNEISSVYWVMKPTINRGIAPGEQD